MKALLPLLFVALLLDGCGSGPEAVKPPVRENLDTKEALYAYAKTFLANQKYDSAEVYLKKSSALDAAFREPVNELAQMYYALGMQQAGEKNPRRLEQFRKSLTYYGKLESMGVRESELFERLGELSNALDDDKSLLKYARKNAEAFPYDRQYFNLGFAYFQVADYQSVIRCQKEAIEKFKGSSFIGSFYRQLGRAYLKVDRDQTAERTFDAGLKATDGVIADMKRGNPKFESTADYRRLVDDKIGMLISLRSLHQTYSAADKLKAVEKQLKELGYNK
jgi:tetratricopeptide (TPR) repeat protein